MEYQYIKQNNFTSYHLYRSILVSLLCLFVRTYVCTKTTAVCYSLILAVVLLTWTTILFSTLEEGSLKLSQVKASHQRDIIILLSYYRLDRFECTSIHVVVYHPIISKPYIGIHNNYLVIPNYKQINSLIYCCLTIINNNKIMNLCVTIFY